MYTGIAFGALFLILVISWRLSESSARMDKSIKKTDDEINSDHLVTLSIATRKPSNGTTQKPSNPTRKANNRTTLKAKKDTNSKGAQRFADAMRLRQGKMTPEEFRAKWEKKKTA